MKTDRLFLTWTAAALLAGLLAPGPSGAGGIHVGPVRIGIDIERPSKKWAAALAPQVQEVQKRFGDNRRALRAMNGADGKPAYLRKDVADLIDRTGKDLDDAIVKVQPSDLQPLRDWAAAELARVQGELGAVPGPKTAAMPAGLFAPQPVEVIASLGSAPKKKPASPKPANPKPVVPATPPPDAVPAGTTGGLLDEVGKVVDRIFSLASHDDLEMKLWVGSTVSPATFSFWSEGKIKDSPPDPTTIRLDGKKDHVLRGLYRYRAAWTQGKVTQIIEYPQPAGAQTTPTERLDLVNGSGFFCCRFDEQYCHAVDNEKDCR
jgi:hypothetical protein